MLGQPFAINNFIEKSVLDIRGIGNGIVVWGSETNSLGSKPGFLTF